MARYSNISIINNRFMSTFPSINIKSIQRDDDIIVEIENGTRIDQLATQYLNDGKLWWVICLLNGAFTPFDKKFLTGNLIRIPRTTNHILNLIK